MTFGRQLLGCGVLWLAVGCGGRTGLVSFDSDATAGAGAYATGGLGNVGSGASAALGGAGAQGLSAGAAGGAGNAGAGMPARTGCTGTLLLGTAPGIALPDASGNYDATAQIVVGDFDGDRKLDLVTADESRGDTVVRLHRRDNGLKFDPGRSLNQAGRAVHEGIAARDFTGDGQLDVLIASGTSLLLFAQDDAGGFELSNSYPVTGAAHSLAVADLHGDQRQDLVVASYSGDSLDVLFAQPGGGFSASSNYATGFPAGWSAATPVVVDLDRDGHADIAVSEPSQGVVSVLFSDALGPFAARADLAVGSNPQGLVAADFDGDGAFDLATSDDGGVSVIHNRGAGTFDPAREYALSGGARWLGVADFNEDGALDLVGVGQNGVAVLLGGGDGTFQVASSYAIGRVSSGAIADLDGDGHLDLIAAQVGVILLLGDGRGHFVERGPDPSTGPSPLSLSVGDVNQDGQLDLVTANHDRTTTSGSGSSLSVLLGDGFGRFTSQTTATVQKTDAVALADFDRDGLLDAVTVDDDGGLATLRRGHGDGTFDSKPLAVQVDTVTALDAVDFNGDGYPDLAYLVAYDLVVAINDQHGDFLVPNRYSFQGSPVGFDIADHDFNGTLDVAIATHEPDTLLLYAGDGSGAFVSSSTVSLPNRPNGVASGDLNADGLTDYAIADAAGVTVLMARSDGSYVASSLDLQVAETYGAKILDMNGDQVLDIVSAFRDGVGVTLGVGDGTFSLPALPYQVGSAAGVSADFNGDGVPDGVALNSNSISILLSGCRN